MLCLKKGDKNCFPIFSNLQLPDGCLSLAQNIPLLLADTFFLIERN